MGAIMFICGGLMIYCWVGLLRNNLVLKHFHRAINMSAEAAKHIIYNSDGGNWKRCHALLEEYPSQSIMVFLLIANWSFDGLFPNYQKRLDQIIEEECKQN